MLAQGGGKGVAMPGVYELFVEENFSAAHCLDGYEGNCSRIHGHNWKVTLCIECRELNEIGIGVDFRRIRKELREALEMLDHKHLNDLAPFRGTNPTSENIARWLYGRLAEKINSGEVTVSRVMVAETGSSGVSYREE